MDKDLETGRDMEHESLHRIWDWGKSHYDCAMLVRDGRISTKIMSPLLLAVYKYKTPKQKQTT